MESLYEPSIFRGYQKNDSLYNQLLAMPPGTAGSPPKTTPKNGIYLFSDNGQHLYLGRSNNIRGRIDRHCRPGATHRMAAFAFHLAREATGFLRAAYIKEGSRKALMEIPKFTSAFSKSKERIRMMDLRFIEIYRD
jgi:hypothetical protein